MNSQMERCHCQSREFHTHELLTHLAVNLSSKQQHRKLPASMQGYVRTQFSHFVNEVSNH